MSYKVYVFMIMCLYFFDDSKKNMRMKKQPSFFSSCEFHKDLFFPNISWWQKSLAVYMVQGFTVIQFYQITEYLGDCMCSKWNLSICIV